MPEIVAAFPGKAKVAGTAGMKPRIDWANYADGAIHKLSSGDYECEPKNLPGQAKRYAVKNGKTLTYELVALADGSHDFYLQMTANAKPAEAAPAEAAPAPAVQAGVDPFAPQPSA